MEAQTCAQGSDERIPDTGVPLSTLPARWYVPALVGAFVFQAALLVVVGVRNREMMNPDAVSYIRTASYYLHGQMDIAVNGLWGPLLSWIMVPMLPLFRDPLVPARIAVGLSALVFLAGCLSLFRAFRLSRPAVLAGTWLAAVTSAAWSVEAITPDLLLAGLLALGCSFILAPSWPTRARAQVGAGLLLGVAYLAKGIAFPFTFLLLAAISTMQLITGRGNTRTTLWAAARTMAVFAVIAVPWVIALSLHYGHPVFSTAGAINHANTGPQDAEDREAWARPAAGRISPGEDPLPLPSGSWSPLHSLAYARYQAQVIVWHFYWGYATLAQFDLVGIGLIILVAAFLLHKPWRSNMRDQPWRWAGLPVACLLAWYLPVHFGEVRYCWPAYPFMLGAALGMAEWLTADAARHRRLIRAAVLTFVLLAFLAPAAKAAAVALRGQESAEYVCAKDLGRRLDAAGVPGPIASIGPGERVGLYVSFLRSEQWYGRNNDPSAQDIKSVGAPLFLISRHSSLRQRLEAEDGLQNLDARLFASPAEAAACSVVVYGAR